MENVDQFLKERNSAENLKDPAYPAGHPMNATFDPSSSSGEKAKRPSLIFMQDDVIEQVTSPLGLSSSSSFTSNLIA